MKKAINLYVGKSGTREKIKYIKDTGFDGIALGINNSTENIKIDELVKILKDSDFDIIYMHCSYFEPELKYIWEEGETGEQIIEDFLQQVKQTANYAIKNFVIHTNGGYNPSTTEIGLKRIRKLLLACKKYDMNLCIENLYDYKQLKYIFDNIEDENLF